MASWLKKTANTNTLNLSLPHSLLQRLLQHWAQHRDKFKMDERSAFLWYDMEKEQLWKGKWEWKTTDELSSKSILLEYIWKLNKWKLIPLKPLLLTYALLSFQMPPSIICGCGSICLTDRDEENSPHHSMKQQHRAPVQHPHLHRESPPILLS